MCICFILFFLLVLVDRKLVSPGFSVTAFLFVCLFVFSVNTGNS